MYRGKFKCSQSLCGVPVIVCNACRVRATEEPRSLSCELCKRNIRAPKATPDLVQLKRKAEEATMQVATSGSDVNKDDDRDSLLVVWYGNSFLESRSLPP